MSPGHGDRRRPSLEALRDNLKLLLRRPGTPTLPAGDHLDPSATTTFTIDRRSFLLVVVLFRHYPRPPLCRRDGMSQHQANRVSPPGRLLRVPIRVRLIVCLVIRPRACASAWPIIATASDAACITPSVAPASEAIRFACRSSP